VVLSDPSSNRRREVTLNIAANGIQQINSEQGWVFAPGQHVLMSHAQLGTADYEVPQL
jgi:hypothetical protein